MIKYSILSAFLMSSCLAASKKIPVYKEFITKLDPQVYKKEPLEIKNDLHYVADQVDKKFLNTFFKMRKDLCSKDSPNEKADFLGNPSLRRTEDEHVPRVVDTLIESHIPDCRSLYLKFKQEGIIKEGNNRIYLLREESTKTKYVYKVYNNPDEYSRELYTFQVTKHPNLMRGVCFHYENISKRPGLVMEYIKGKTALQWSINQPYEKLKYIVAQMLIALNYLHRSGLLHSDFKPENVIVEEGTERVVLFDFGFTVPVEQGRRGLGTKKYEAPELFGLVPGPVRTGVDMWALAMTIIAMAGVQSYGLMYNHSLNVNPLIRDGKKSFTWHPIPDKVPKEVRDVVYLLTSLDPLEREFVTYRQLDILINMEFFNGVDWKGLNALFYSDIFQFEEENH